MTLSVAVLQSESVLRLRLLQLDAPNYLARASAHLCVIVVASAQIVKSQQKALSENSEILLVAPGDTPQDMSKK